MSHSPELPRRGFLGRLAAGAAALTALSTPAVARAERVLARRADDPDAWLNALTGKHRQIYDVISVEQGGPGTAFAHNFLNANNSGYGLSDKDVNAVVSFRHFAAVLGLNNDMWAKYHIADMVKQLDANSKLSGDTNPLVGKPEDANSHESSSITALASRGVVFTVCGMAMGFVAGQLAKQTSQAADAVHAELRRNFVPNGIEVVAGVIAVNRAQEHGLSYVYVG
ncbi:MAG TPA: hypothetical protein VG818_11060, partial [Gemmatimonadaceae bacterium]|jgi:hypothetical protein|nr:hypothetical protein [Gemmatimonadaceae bacterium]